MKPNIILINCDDLGYADFGCYGSTLNHTPYIDSMAREGITFTDFYMAAPVCTPSRGGMMTGCYPPRISFGLFTEKQRVVLFPGDATGLNPEENTIASLLKDEGYATMLVGKWHCGDQEPFLPTKHGFDQYFGIPFSNDMGMQNRGETPPTWAQQYDNGTVPPLPLMQDEKVIQEQPDQAALTERYTEKCIEFMNAHRDRPFFLYLAHTYVHHPLYVPQAFEKKSENGVYGAAVECIDWSTGAILAEMKRLGIDEDTLIIMTSDNGGTPRGSNGPLRGTKGTTWEGGQRVPCVMRWKETIPSGITCSSIASAIDFLPTFVNLTGGAVPEEQPIDGVDISALLKGDRTEQPRNTFLYCHRNRIEAVRKGKYKLHLLKSEESTDSRDETPELYDLESDLSESIDISEDHPQIVSELREIIETARRELGDSSMGIEGRGVRPIGRVDDPKPLTVYDPDHPYMVAEYD